MFLKVKIVLFGPIVQHPLFSKMARIVVPQIQELTIFGCCKQSLTRLYHPSIHPASPIVFMGLIPNFYFINFKKAFFCKANEVFFQNFNFKLFNAVQMLKIFSSKLNNFIMNFFPLFEIIKI